MTPSEVIGIDIGGANTKVASACGRAKSFYMPLWRANDLVGVLRRIKDEFRPQKVGVVMTGELADAFSSKKEGVCSIASLVNSVFENPFYLNVRREFTPTIDMEDAHLYAASNWTASTSFLAKNIKNCIFVDYGSTTCDVIPIKDGRIVASRTDFERLGAHELIYTGVLRTNVAALLRFAALNGTKYRLSSELFAITADVHRILANLSEADYACDTPDSRSRDLEACYRRMARVMLSDVDELGKENTREVALQVKCAQRDDLAEALVCQSQKNKLSTVVGAGLGEFLVAEAALKVGLECHLLSTKYGREISNVFPAYAVARLLHHT